MTAACCRRVSVCHEGKPNTPYFASIADGVFVRAGAAVAGADEGRDEEVVVERAVGSTVTVLLKVYSLMSISSFTVVPNLSATV